MYRAYSLKANIELARPSSQTVGPTSASYSADQRVNWSQKAQRALDEFNGYNVDNVRQVTPVGSLTLVNTAAW